MEKLRQEIDKIDDAMRALFEERMDCVQAVVAYKVANQIGVRDRQREEAMIEKNLKKLNNPDYCEMYEYFLREIIRTSVEFQEEWLEQKIK